MYNNKEWLEEQFSIPGSTIQKVSILAGCNEKTIRRWMKRLEVKSRPRSESATLWQCYTTPIHPYLTSVIEGELLGDGSLISRSMMSAKYQCSSKYREYIEWLFEIFQSYELPPVGIWHDRSTNSFRGSTRTVLELYSIYSRFYEDKIKVVPQDLKLNPTICLHWYLGDGFRQGKKCLLATNCFSKQSLEVLCDQLKSFNPIFRRFGRMLEPYGYCIRVDLDFLDYIGDCPTVIENIYGYKWDRGYTRNGIYYK